VGGGYDIVVANIVADVIAHLTPKVPSLLKPGGLYIASGIIEDHLPRILSAMEEAGLTVLETQQKGPWCVIAAGMPA
jgi:ribosomal protein L11 methyltransferase